MRDRWFDEYEQMNNFKSSRKPGSEDDFAWQDEPDLPDDNLADD